MIAKNKSAKQIFNILLDKLKLYPMFEDFFVSL